MHHIGKKKKQIRKLFCRRYNEIRKWITHNNKFWFDWKKEIWSKKFETGKTAGLLYQIKNTVGWRRRKAINIFYIYLETNKFTHKTIPKLVNESGNVITDQNQILQEAKTYYENLYSKRDTVSNINLKNEIPYTGIPTLSDEIKDNLEGEITYAELTASIKRMKNEKKS